MHRVILSNIEPTKALDFKDQLVRDGLVMHKDFDWEYHPSWDGFSQELPRHVVFRFRNAVHATFYQLKWA